MGSGVGSHSHMLRSPVPGGTRHLTSLSTVSSLWKHLVAKLPQPLAQAFGAGEGGCTDGIGSCANSSRGLGPEAFV